NADSAMALARASYTAQLWGVARQLAQKAIDYRPDRAAFRLMADIEQADRGEPKKIRAWLDKAGDAPPEPQWQCLVTAEIFQSWQVLNRQSDFNTIEWQTPLPAGRIEKAVVQIENKFN
ncbi:MAG: hypothetical protein JWM96_1426, partial [Alphaproteobacteria bacterium]|nr:hypothetical protein [Alphaproteobacteria bacterium]